jgi:hypothetical protein
LQQLRTEPHERLRRGPVCFLHYGCSVLCNDRANKHAAAEPDDRFVSRQGTRQWMARAPGKGPVSQGAKWHSRPIAGIRQSWRKAVISVADVDRFSGIKLDFPTRLRSSLQA